MTVDAARLDFDTLRAWSRDGGGRQEPYPYTGGEPAVSPEALRALADERVSVRSYQDRDVDRSLIDAAVDIAMQSPSACNRLPYEFRFYDDTEIRPRLVDLAPGMAGWGHTAPVVGALIGKYRAYFHVRDRHAIYVDASLASMAFQMALVTMGLGSCSVNWPQLCRLDRDVGRLLNLEADEKVIMLIALGHPADKGMVPYSGKRSMDEIRSYNRL